MILYHYRPIESALLEIGNGTLHFAARTELNDPIEGYIRVFWQGDRAAWEGLFRNYICSLSRAIELYLLDGPEDMLHHRTLMVDINRFNDVPYGKLLKQLSNSFLADENICRLAAFYGNHQLKVQEKELRLILHFIHQKALIFTIEKYLERELIPRDEGRYLLDQFHQAKKIEFPFESLDAEQPRLENRSTIAAVAEEFLADMREFQYVQFGLNDEAFLYGRRTEKAEEGKTEARRHRNWLSITIDFPRLYVDQLKEMVYPESFVVCFSTKSDNSAMWGNYADQHRGICIMYETDEKNRFPLKGNKALVAQPVIYGGGLIERNFFETFGRLTKRQIQAWLTGLDGISSAYEAFQDEDAWRERYWNAFADKNYRKTSEWSYENEYRLVVDNSFYSYEEPGSRNLEYDFHALKGIIFGINTSEYDKKRMMEKLLIHADKCADCSFFQAEYADETQSIVIREKVFWKLKQS